MRFEFKQAVWEDILKASVVLRSEVSTGKKAW